MKGTLRLLDPLTNHLQWGADTKNNSGTGCEYSGGVFYIKDKTFESYNVCPSDFDTFSNFAIEVQAMMIHYGCEGITFRANSNKYYMFTICQNQTGSYCKLLKYRDSKTNTFSALLSTKRLQNNMEQWNMITVRVIGSQINLYINQNLIKSVVDSEYNTGYIGFLAQNLSDNSEVEYRMARIWTVN